MKLIRKGLEKGYDVSTYAIRDYSVWQMHQIISGLEHGLNVSIYAKPCFDTDQMEMLFGRVTT